MLKKKALKTLVVEIDVKIADINKAIIHGFFHILGICFVKGKHLQKVIYYNTYRCYRDDRE